MSSDPHLEALQECIQSKLCLILRESGFGKIEINVERIRVDKVAITVHAGVSRRFVYTEADIQDWLDLQSTG
jgi:hypothetical protein